ncbi:hypothetical protein GIW32_29015, partial [Pseudomonas syringae]
WGALFISDKQMAYAKNVKEGWLTPEETAGLDQWVKDTSWLDAQKGRQLDIKERATLITELVAAGGMALLGGRSSVGTSTLGAKGARNLPLKDADRIAEVNKTLDRIETGGPFPYKQDGTIFRNKEGKLPEGDYREYTVDTPGANNRAKRRVVQDASSGRTYYTEDHYDNFIQVDPIRR